MADSDESSPAGFNRTVAGIKYVLGKTFKSAVKGAVIGGLALGAASLIPGGPLLLAGVLPFVGGTATGAAAGLMGSWVVTGALAGAGIGGAIGLASGVSNVEDAVEDEAQAMVTKDMRKRQLEANQEMMAMNMERMRSAQRNMGVGSLSHGLGGMGIKQQGGLDVGNA